MHLLVILDQKDRLRTVDDYDMVVSAEIPDPNKFPILYDRVMSHMLHTHNKICWKQNKCKRKFPKEYTAYTHTKEDGYPVYRRRSPDQVSFSVHYS